MSKKIYYHDQDRLDNIFEQVKALSGVVDELRTEVDNLKKISLSARRKDILFECTKVNCEIDRIRPFVLGEVETYTRDVRDLTTTETICQLVENSQVVFKIYYGQLLMNLQNNLLVNIIYYFDRDFGLFIIYYFTAFIPKFLVNVSFMYIMLNISRL